MKHRLFHLFAALSLLLALLTAALGARSYWRYEGVWREGGAAEWSLVSFGGRLVYHIRPRYDYGPVRSRYDVTVLPQMTSFQPMLPPMTWYERLGFSYRNEQIVRVAPGVPGRDVWLILPHWFAAAVFSVLPMVWFILWCRKRKNLARGFEVEIAPATSIY